MIASFRKILYPVFIFFSIGFLVFLFNQITSLFLFANEINPLAGQAVLWGSVLVLSFLILYPVFIFLRLPKSIQLPQSEEEIPVFRKRLAQRLKSNPILKDMEIVPNEDNLEETVAVLNKEAETEIKNMATVVFLTTSVSQNGKLDAFTVLATQIKLVWRVAHIYYQRPSLRDIGYLYANVAGSAFLANEIEDLNISEQLEPITSAMFRNVSGKSIPVLGTGANIILDSLLEGSTNAFLTLRVGNIAKRYCGQLGVADRREIRTAAIKESASQLKNVAMNASGKVVSGIASAAKNAGVDTLKNSWEGVKTAGEKIKDGVVDVSDKINPFKKRTLSEE